MRNYLNYTDDDIIKYAAETKSIAELLQKLNLKLAGGNYANIKSKLQQLNLDCPHWIGQSWNKGQRLKDWSNYKAAKNLKPHIIKERGHKCEQCGLIKWQNKLIPLEIDHIDGDKTNNNKNNLKLLCCNCHALTPTWRGRNIKKTVKIKKYCKNCNKEITKSKSGFCSSCFNKQRVYSINNRKVKNRPNKEQLLQEIAETNYCAVGRKYGVSDNAIRKWLK